MPRTIIFSLLLLLAACSGGSSSPPGSPPPPTPLPPPSVNGSGGVNDIDKQDRPYIILVSFDGFRANYQDMYATPALDRLTSAGVKAEALVPVYPTLTFPNHYSIATGLDPSNHGIVANAFPSRDRSRFYSLSDPSTVGDGTWYGGEPIWVATESTGMVTATYYFVGTEAAIGGIRPTFWQSFDASVPGDVRVDQVLTWLNRPIESRPHMITLYFGDVDRTGHIFGPESAQTAASVGAVDQHLGRLLDGIQQSPVADNVYVIVVSDHGMSTQLPGSTIFMLDSVVTLDGITVVGSGAYAFLFFDNPDATRAAQIRDTINASWTNGRAYLKEDVPTDWNISPTSRFPDVIVQPDPQHLVVSDASRLNSLPTGFHGWEPDFSDMHGIFVASGPRLAAGTTIAPVEGTDVYALMLEILDIPLSTPIDGDSDTLPSLLQN